MALYNRQDAVDSGQVDKKNVEKAISYLERSISLAKGEKVGLELAKSLYELGKVLKENGKTKEAEKNLKEAEKIFKKIGAGKWLNKVQKLWKELKE